MKELVKWLIGAEKGAAELYAKAASVFSENKRFSTLLCELSDDEMDHHRTMRLVDGFGKLLDEYEGVLTITDDWKEEFAVKVRALEQELASGSITEHAMLDALIELETSEINDIFMFVMDVLKEKKRELVPHIKEYDKHKNRIADYLAEQGDTVRKMRIEALPDMWIEKILVVDDHGPVRKLIKTLIRGEGEVDMAVDGLDAMSKLKEKYYAAIISDVNMPRMDGLEFYENASKEHPGIGKRFLFFTANSDASTLRYFEENSLSYFEKPSPPQKIVAAVKKLLNH